MLFFVLDIQLQWRIPPLKTVYIQNLRTVCLWFLGTVHFPAEGNCWGSGRVELLRALVQILSFHDVTEETCLPPLVKFKVFPWAVTQNPPLGPERVPSIKYSSKSWALSGFPHVPVADMSPVATRAPEAFSLVLTSIPTGGSGTMRWIWSPPGTFELDYGSSSQNKWETFWRSRGHGGHMCTRSISGA